MLNISALAVKFHKHRRNAKVPQGNGSLETNLTLSTDNQSYGLQNKVENKPPVSHNINNS